MNVKKFTGASSRDALRKVREALGPDAVILSNRQADGVVEILALANDDAASLASPPAASEMSQPRPQLQTQFATPQRPAAPAQRPAAPRPAAPRQAAGEPVDMARMQQMMASALAHVKENAAAEMSGMMNEIRAMRGMMETQLAEISWGSTQQREPQKAVVLREMLAAGFSASLARYLIDKLPAGLDGAQSMRWIKTVLSRNLNTVANEDAMLEQGGVFALVGPTGVGKTTSTAKLAARCVMRHGPEKLALITTDAYRIGAHEQLRIYGKILGVMVHSVKDEADLRIALKELKNKHTVLIDTVGVSQRDQMVTEQVAMLSGAGADVKRLLCLNSTATQETLNEVVRAYQGSGLAGCIMTKLDEAASIGNVLDVVIRQKLNLFYVSNGQRVPEDLYLADRGYLIDRAFKLKRDAAATQFSDAELPLLMAQAAARNNEARGVRLG
ncbi:MULTISPECIES: flagellar biosynthesis protein FlhF [Janthinobacterium]|jgi:flagellar biosynthesis protein FlhF|uniref:Flagellar biosynthesis protein FlhF n=1 Tax=Janthinobacterium tructae TaxID=2590869 RepID=A0A4Y6RF11_9BURK|nr:MULTISPECIES: flagellar biosynthesis protein FlhF [Janthinobacterium]MBH2070905.1 flagellar biosynthesis protein FlhF [Burkholderiales bacterium]MDI3293462.1 flagellar biosynthesis protein FlhF [Janthinobacterium tructae]MDN2695393.1 flagellar biosynthesis protein FlhF [Janthinobacterium sp. SUN073]PIG29220.1 flagellar biosynthesis protein FlhF [Janthinobacterium sp. 35]PKB21777.1 flagellar biosynthesis protein FlhF [Janthinobacterium sp. 64]